MGEVIRFIPRSELERTRMIRAARAIYESVFPPADRIGEGELVLAKQPARRIDTHRNDEPRSP